ncbi:hypothetical protein MTO96_045068 [Rhipicephalus appendiculatus]
MSGYHIPANVVLRTEWFVAGRLEDNFTQASTFLPGEVAEVERGAVWESSSVGHAPVRVVAIWHWTTNVHRKKDRGDGALLSSRTGAEALPS